MDACFETWIDAVAKWYHLELVRNLVKVRIDGADNPLPDGLQPLLQRVILDDCQGIAKAALRKLERPAAPEVAEITCDRAMAQRLTQEVHEAIGGIAVARLIVAKPFAVLRLWWGELTHMNNGKHRSVRLYGTDRDEGSYSDAPPHSVADYIVTDLLGVTDLVGLINGDGAGKPIADWFRARPDGPWYLTADEVGKLLERVDVADAGGKS
jgi:hypothetical protein